MFPVFLLATQFAQFGDAVSVTLDSSVTYASTSNIYKTPERTSDDYFVWSPGLKIDLSQGESNFDLSLSIAHDLNRYQRLSNLDSDLLRASLFGSYRGAVTQVLLSYGMTEGQSAQSELQGQTNPSLYIEDLIETKTDTLSLIAKYRYSPKLSFSSGINAYDLSYSTYASRFSSKESFTIPIDVIYHYSEKLDMIYGIEYTNKEIGLASSDKGGYSTDEVYYKVGLSGDIRPKLDGNISVGLRHIEFSNEDVINYSKKETLGIQSALSWRHTPKFTSILNLSRNYDTAGSGDSYNQTKVSLINRYTIKSDLSINTLASLSSKQYLSGSRRSDELDRYEVNLDYFPHQNVIISAGYAYSNSRSVSRYEAEDLSIKASILY